MSNFKNKTFDEWKAGRHYVMNIETKFPEVGKLNSNGFIYPDGSWILLGYNEPNKWYTICNNDKCEHENLFLIELFLWENHSRHEYTDPFDEEEKQLADGFKYFCETHGYKHESMDEVHAKLMIMEQNKKHEWKTVKKHLKECNDWMNKWIDMIERRNQSKAIKS